MSTIILLVLLGGCLVMHFFMMRKHGHEGDHENMKAKETLHNEVVVKK